GLLRVTGAHVLELLDGLVAGDRGVHDRVGRLVELLATAGGDPAGDVGRDREGLTNREREALRGRDPGVDRRRLDVAVAVTEARGLGDVLRQHAGAGDGGLSLRAVLDEQVVDGLRRLADVHDDLVREGATDVRRVGLRVVVRVADQGPTLVLVPGAVEHVRA